MNLRPFLTVCLLGAVTSLAPVAGQVGGARADQSIDDVVEAAMSRAFTPGAVVAIVVRDSVVFLKAYGRTALDPTAAPLATDALFRAGPVTEFLNAIAATRLAGRGDLELDAPIGALVPEVPAELRPVTMRQLLSHTAGLAALVAVPGRDRGDDLGAAARRLTRLDRLAPGGAIYSHSELGISLAGLALERAGKRPYADVLAAEVLEPFGMSRSTIAIDARPGLTPGYNASTTVDAPVQPAPVKTDSAVMAPLSGLRSTASDLARLGAALLNDGVVQGVRVLPEGGSSALLDWQAAVPGSIGHSALGVRIGAWRGQAAVGIAGGGHGHGVFMHLVPAARLGVIVLTNMAGSTLPDVSNFVFERMIQVTAGPAATPDPAPPDTAVLADMVSAAGRYLNGSELLEVVVTDGRPLLKSGDIILEVRPVPGGYVDGHRDGRTALRFRFIRDATGRPYIWIGRRALGRELAPPPR